MVQTGIVDGFESWYGPLVSRRISYVLAWLIVRHTSLTANAVTCVMVACGVIGVLLCAVPDAVLRLLGVILLHLWLVLDAVDGEVARGRGTSSPAGIYLDAVGHYLVNPGLLWVMVLSNPGLNSALAWPLATVSFVVGAVSKAVEGAAAEAVARMGKSRTDPRYRVQGRGPGTAEVTFSVDVPRAGLIRSAKRFGVTDAATSVTVLTITAITGVLVADANGFVALVQGVAALALTLGSLGRAAYLFYANYSRLAQ